MPHPCAALQGADLVADDGNLMTAQIPLGSCCEGCRALPECGAFVWKDEGWCFFKAC